VAYVIAQYCCNDAVCVDVCPVDCIHPTPAEAGYSTAEQLYIDPAVCVDCNACLEACPVEAIFREQDLLAPLARFAQINADYYGDRSRAAA
jgi:NAD-dependent dihydropyrimidine dehydrogenase PreA subunit